MRVSVIIPTYNRANYLSLALQSILGQSLCPAEIIVVDDGSTDDTGQVVRAFDSRLRFLRQSHTGVSAARNLGLEAACGEIVAWLDADDLWEPDFLATTIAVLASDDQVDGVYTGLLRIDADGNLLPQVGVTVVPPSELYASLAEDCFIQTSTFVARRTCYEQVGRFDCEFEICEDYDMFLRLAKSFTIAGVPTPLVRYRVHEHNTVANAAAFCRYRLALTQKHFGMPEGDPEVWPVDKRLAHACAFRAAALKCIQSSQTDQGWRYLEQSVSIWPGLLGRLDTLYELACGDQPMGYRGQADRMDIEKNGAEILQRLEALFDIVPALRAMRGKAYGNAYLALGMLSDQAGHWKEARGYLYRAVRSDPWLLTSYTFIRRLLKLWSGKRLVRLGRALRRAG